MPPQIPRSESLRATCTACSRNLPPDLRVCSSAQHLPGQCVYSSTSTVRLGWGGSGGEPPLLLLCLVISFKSPKRTSKLCLSRQVTNLWTKSPNCTRQVVALAGVRALGSNVLNQSLAPRPPRHLFSSILA